MARVEVPKSLLDSIDDLHGVMQEARPKGHDPLQVLLADFPLRQVQVALAEVPREVPGAVAVQLVIDRLDLVKHATDLDRREPGVVQEADELIEGPLKVDVVFPESVVGVEDEVQSHTRAPKTGRMLPLWLPLRAVRMISK